MKQASKNPSSHFRKFYHGFAVPLHLQHKKEDVHNADSCENCMVQTDCENCIQKAPKDIKANFSKAGI
jgi:hypothetical protein